MIDALHHITVAASSVDAAVRAYATLLGRSAEPDSAAIQLANVRVQFAVSQDGNEGLSELALATADIEKARRLLANRALPAVEVARSLRIDPTASHQVALSLVQRNLDAMWPSAPAAVADAAVAGLDHVVIRTADPERAIALYAGRLGLSLRLDRSEPAWGARMLFFRCGDLIIEVVHDTKVGAGGGADRLWGLSWRVGNIEAAHARLQAAGIEVSDIRSGRRPGTRVFTVRNNTAGVPTLMIAEKS